MEWDLYLTLKTAGIAVFVFAGGFSVSRALGISRPKAYVLNAVAVLAGFVVSRLWYILQHVYGSEEYQFRQMNSLWAAASAWDDAGAVLYGWILGGTQA